MPLNLKEAVKQNYWKGCLIGLPLLLIAAVLSIPYGVCMVVYQQIREKQFYHRLAAKERVLSWKEVERHLINGEGTLIVEQAHKNPTRFWWTPDDLLTSDPAPPLEFDDLGLDYMNRGSSNPFVKWCFANYLAREGGKAFLTRPVLKISRGSKTTGFWKALYAKAKIVHTICLAESC